MERYEHIKQFTVKYCEADFKDEMKLSVALSYMEEVACSSAEELGFGYSYVKPKGYAFMLTNLCCSFLRPVSLGELVCVKTWPTPPSYVIFGREYQFLTPNGDVIMNATSRWCLIDLSTGKILPSKIIEGQDYQTYNTTRTMQDVQWKLPAFNVEQEELRFSLTIANSEYDHNLHVNNTRYADYCLNCFSVEELADSRVCKFNISYVKQCREGETLRFFRKRLQENTYLVQGVNDLGETVVQAQITFTGKGDVQ